MSPQYLLSVPLKMLRPWAFMGMAAQVSESPDSVLGPLGRGTGVWGGGGGWSCRRPRLSPALLWG